MGDYRDKHAPIRKWGIRKDAYFNREQMMAAYKLYSAGMNVPQITSQIWKKMGYSSHVSCSRALWTLFRTHKLKMRSAGRVRWMHMQDKNRRCKRCNCHHDDRTIGCRSCQGRHQNRKNKKIQEEKDLAELQKKLKLCAGCGCTNDIYVEGCPTCWDRRRGRERRAAA